MWKRSLFYILAIIVAVTAAFFAGFPLSDHRTFIADLLATINVQKNATSSSNTTVTLENSTGAISTPTLGDVLQELQSQEQILTDQVVDLRSRLEVANLRTVFTRVIKRGDSGDDVSTLQELLEKIPGVYPHDVNSSSRVTGYYGSLTKMAVTEFQTQAGLKQTGVVDQDTRKKLYASAAHLIVDENTSTEFIDLSTVTDLQTLPYLGEQISQSSNTQTMVTDLQDQVSQLASNVSSSQATISDLQNQISQITSNISNIQASIVAVQNPPPSPSPAPSPAPAPAPTPFPLLTISHIQVLNITKTSSTVTWLTNNPSTSEVNYSKNSSMSSGQISVTSTTMVTSHSLRLSNLDVGTQYHYRVISKDSTGAVASSTILSFSTLQ